MKKFVTFLIAILILAAAVFIYIRFYFVYGEGVRSGELNYVVYKGILWKTYEGKLIQAGLKSRDSGSVQSNTFEFSVENEELAKELMSQSGNTLELHYKEYYGKLPWRGHTRYIVDEIVSLDKEKEAL